VKTSDMIALIIALTVCSFVILVEVHWYSAPIGSIPDKSMDLMSDFLNFMMGGVFGYIGGNNCNTH